MKVGSAEHKKIIVDSKRDILEILQIARNSLFWATDKQAIEKEMLEVAELYKKL